MPALSKAELDRMPPLVRKGYEDAKRRDLESQYPFLRPGLGDWFGEFLEGVSDGP